MSNEFPKLQQLMNQAYERWAHNSNWSQAQFWSQLSWPERVAVFVGNLNYQVENGGFYQWHDNGYSECHRDLVIILKQLGSTGNKVADMVEKVMNELKEVQYSDNYLDEDDDGFHDDKLGLSPYYDNEFYTINQALLAETEAFVGKLL